MKKPYKHLSCEERDKLSVLRAKGKSLSQIAKLLGRDKGTLSRELKRNKTPINNVYFAHRAHQRAVIRKRLSVRRERLRSLVVKTYVIQKLKQKWSPELIAGRLPIERPGHFISHEAIYQFVYDLRTRKKLNLVPYLTRSHKRRFPRTHSHRHKELHIPYRVSIKERPQEANNRKVFGHWEADTIVSRKRSPALMLSLERVSRKIHLAKLPTKTARHFSTALNRRLAKHPQHMRCTITYDNGCENVEHIHTNKVLGTTSYFCEPFHSWEKASVENAAGLVRRFFPKKTDFAIITKEQVKHVEKALNNRPRKCLGFKTPLEIFASGVALRG